MTITEKMLAIWSADSTAIAVVPASRFKPPGDWQNIALPYILQYPIVETATQVHNGGGALMALRTWDFYQLTVIAASYTSAETVAEKLRSVFTGNIDGVQFFYRGRDWVGQNEITKAEHMAVHFKIVERLAS